MHLKELRKARNMTQSQLAKVAKVSQRSIANYEDGTRTPRLAVLMRISDYFGVSVDYLLRNQDGTCQ